MGASFRSILRSNILAQVASENDRQNLQIILWFTASAALLVIFMAGRVRGNIRVTHGYPRVRNPQPFED